MASTTARIRRLVPIAISVSLLGCLATTAAVLTGSAAATARQLQTSNAEQRTTAMSNMLSQYFDLAEARKAQVEAALPAWSHTANLANVAALNVFARAVEPNGAIALFTKTGILLGTGGKLSYALGRRDPEFRRLWSEAQNHGWNAAGMVDDPAGRRIAASVAPSLRDPELVFVSAAPVDSAVAALMKG